MTTPNIANSPDEVLDTYRLHDGLNVFSIGLFDKSVTVLSQQSRALNLAWALTETMGFRAGTAKKKIAIVGAGFAGLSLAAGLVSKQANVEITLLEQRDSVLPLQHGNDTRWLHPHIYDWPQNGSTAHSAGLPVLNWTAARASDVVVQVRTAWEELRAESKHTRLKLFCNTASVQVDLRSEHGNSTLVAEWIGQQRKVWNPSVPKGRQGRRGLRDEFDVVVLAIGFGVEADGAMSYWRNETLAQPALRQRRRTYVVSGVGDGGWIDLFRIRVSDFRQDRILGELFGGQQALLSHLQKIQNESIESVSLIPKLREAWDAFPDQGKRVVEKMDQRLRHDTDAILHIQTPRSFDALFNRRVSFQNQLLAWVLHAAGGFSIWDGEIDQLLSDEHVSTDAVVVRHGPKVTEGIQRVLGPGLRTRLDNENSSHGSQSTQNHWLPGYFGTPLDEADDETKKFWRREYLPESTEIVAASMCGSLAGVLTNRHSGDGRLRITLHRVLQIGDSLAFQQCCDYTGVGVADESKTAGRTFPLNMATIGHAYRTKAIVRSRIGVSGDALRTDMQEANLTETAREMSAAVESVVAIPLIASAETGDEGSVVAILFIDTDAPNFFKQDQDVELLASVCAQALAATAAELQRTRAISNSAFPGGAPATDLLGPPIEFASLEVVASVAPPRIDLERLNLDQTTFLEMERQR